MKSNEILFENIYGEIFFGDGMSQDISAVDAFSCAYSADKSVDKDVAVKAEQPFIPAVSDVLTRVFKTVRCVLSGPTRVIGKVRSVVADAEEPLPN